MKKTGKRLAALFSAMVVAMTGTMCLAEYEKAHWRWPLHYEDGSNIAVSEEKTKEVLDEWEPFYEGLGYDREGRTSNKYSDGKYPVKYGGDIKIPVGGKIVIHSAQDDYSLAVAYGQTDLDQYLSHFSLDPEASGVVNVRELSIKEYPHDKIVMNVYCMEHEITGLKNGIAGFVYKTNNDSPRFYRIIVGSEGGSQPAAAAAPAKAASTAAGELAAAVWTAKQL